MNKPNLLHIIRNCAKWRSGALLVATLFPILTLVPGQVNDLRVSAVTDTSVVLTWTEVSSSTTAINRYAIRFGPTSSFSWGSTTDVKTGGCAAPVYGSTAAGGRTRSCVLGGLQSNLPYNFQLIAYTGTLNNNAVFGLVSNIAQAVTAERIGSMLVIRFSGVNTTDTSYVDEISVSGYPGIHNGRYPIYGSFNLGTYTITGFSKDSITARGYLLVTKP